MLIRIEDKKVEEAAERVRRRRGDRSRTEMISLLILEADGSAGENLDGHVPLPPAKPKRRGAK